ncbi:MAG: aminotransferase class I/II-fold pyridoxal phosphate-dependent enzyme [Oscillospiraceae bacterium]|nr:aminotransferase class I/II-fold pyridoxal phosphate-dependent enzyme [Oscillospiraceae bacterium]
MTTPVYDFVRGYIEKSPVRAHMPGHKGASQECGFGAAYEYDITEIKGADALFEADGIILESEKNAAELFGAAETVYSCGGSTACIQTMLACACRKKKRIIAARNAHRAFINSCALLDIDVKWIYPVYSDSIVSGDITAAAVGKALSEYDADAVYITSPDYLGHISDIKEISQVCRRYNAYLLCDNAHGAYTAFLKENIHPVRLGADMCCDSAHKTLPVLTGGAYLHVNNEKLVGQAKEYMSMFCSTSPSYLILQSLDMCNAYLAGAFSEELAVTCQKVTELKERLSAVWDICISEPLKLVIHTVSSGLYGYELADILRQDNIECEYADSTHIVFMLSPKNSDDDLSRLRNALEKVRMPKLLINTPHVKLPQMEQAVSIREAAFSECRLVPVKEAAGKICGRAVTVCPPGIAAAVPGERISDEAAEALFKLGITEINVILDSDWE